MASTQLPSARLAFAGLGPSLHAPFAHFLSSARPEDLHAGAIGSDRARLADTRSNTLPDENPIATAMIRMSANAMRTHQWERPRQTAGDMDTENPCRPQPRDDRRFTREVFTVFPIGETTFRLIQHELSPQNNPRCID
jgi:hypothetical protein